MAKKIQETDNQEERKNQEQVNNTGKKDGSDREKNETEQVNQPEDEASAEENAPVDQDESTDDQYDNLSGNEEEQEKEQEEEVKSPEQLLEEKVADLQDKYLRLSAEYDNYRKRTLREKMELQENAREDIFVNILPVVDDLERALDMVESAKDIAAVKEGMKLIHTKFHNYLKQQGVKEIDAVDQVLDTDLHEAVTKIPVDSKKKKGKVVDVIEKGYMLRDKVIRFAKVVIGE